MSTIIKNSYDKYQQIKLLIFLSVLFLISVAAGSLVLYTTRGGIFVGADSTNYIVPARNLLLGKGFGLYTAQGQFELLQRYPPFYPLVFYFIGLLKLNIILTIRWIHVILFASVVFISGVSFFKYSKSLWQSILLSALIAFAKCLIIDYSWAMSESFYFLFIVLSFVFLIKYLQKPGIVDLFLLGLFCSFMFLDRIAAIANILTIAVVILLFSRVKIWKKIFSLFTFLSLSSIPMVIWTIIVKTNTNTVLGRPLLNVTFYQQRFNEMKLWFEEVAISWIPYGKTIYWISDHHFFKPFWIATFLILTIFGVLLFTWITQKLNTSWTENRLIHLLFTNVLFMCIYIVILILTNILVEFGIAKDSRIFSPIYFSMIFVFVCILSLISLIHINNKSIQIVLILTSLYVVGSVIYHGSKVAVDYPAEGIGYNTVYSRNSQLIKVVNKLPSDIKIITNQGTYLLFNTNRQAYVIQEQFQLEPDWTFPRFGDSKEDEAQNVFVKTNAALVIVGDLNRELSWLYGDQTGDRIKKLTEGLYRYYQGPDGSIYFFRHPDFNNGD